MFDYKCLFITLQITVFDFFDLYLRQIVLQADYFVVCWV